VPASWSADHDLSRALRQRCAAADECDVAFRPAPYRRLSRPLERHAPPARFWLSALACLIALVCVTPSAQAQLANAEEGHVGLRPRSTGLYEQNSKGETVIDPPANAAGNPVVPTSSIYAIYWDPDALYHGDWQKLVNEFLHNLGASSGSDDVFSVDTQYTDSAGQHAATSAGFKGAYTDTDKYPTTGNCAFTEPLVGTSVSCLTDKQIRAELQKFIGDHSLPRGMSTVYYLLTPPGVTACLEAAGDSCSDYSGEPESTNPSYANSFCSYHSAIDPGPGELGSAETVLYGVIPWSAGGLGDGSLAQAPAFDCQAGGWAPGRGEEEAESVEKELTQQEPNQDGRSPDGWFDTGLADLISSQIGIQQQDIATDPLLNAWHDALGGEVTDECRDFYAPSLGGGSGAEKGTKAGTLYNQLLNEGKYYINDAFNLAAAGLAYPGVPCLNGISLQPSFTAPNKVNSGEIVGFDGMESDVTLDWGTAYVSGKATPTYATYEWSFGDGTSVTGFAPGAPPANSPSVSPCEEPWIAPCAASTFHSYTYGGVYPVTLKITDTGGNVASITEPITVDGPAPPSTGGESGSGHELGVLGTSGATETSGSSGATKSGGSSKGGKGAGKAGESNTPLSRPVATAIVATTSLAKAVETGLQVRYSVNQQVAGHFEVLIPTTLARRLKIKGAAAKNLPAGAAPQTLIAYALLITTRRAHGTISIEIPKSTGVRLARLHHVKLTLRLQVRNASRTEPKKTLLQTAVKLHR
jgi:hypothetical protein